MGPARDAATTALVELRAGVPLELRRAIGYTGRLAQIGPVTEAPIEP
jgi:hypothetical protein